MTYRYWVIPTIYGDKNQVLNPPRLIPSSLLISVNPTSPDISDLFKALTLGSW